MGKTADRLFEYLRDLIYDPARASLCIDELDEEYQALGMGLVTFGKFVSEQRQFAQALARGELKAPLPSRDNELAAPLKALHASLSHMTWQSQQVAKGDYQQRIDFMGEFADAFNSMTVQLEARQNALEKEIEAGHQKAVALEQSNRLLTSITAQIPQMLLVLDPRTWEIQYVNQSAAAAIDQGRLNLETVREALNSNLSGKDDYETEFFIGTAGGVFYYAMHAYRLQWSGTDAEACVINDISKDRRYVRELEQQAYRDGLTQLRNRFYGMKAFNEWLELDQAFVLCFVDLDNLKYVNDNYGHMEGDEYILGAARLLEDFSPVTMACRIGGDEFMLLSPDYTAAEAQDRMEELRRALQSAFAAAEKPYHVNMSYGIVAVEEGQTLSASALLGIADERMYQYKRQQKQLRSMQTQ